MREERFKCVVWRMDGDVQGLVMTFTTFSSRQTTSGTGHNTQPTSGWIEVSDSCATLFFTTTTPLRLQYSKESAGTYIIPLPVVLSQPHTRTGFGVGFAEFVAQLSLFNLSRISSNEMGVCHECTVSSKFCFHPTFDI